MLFLILPGVAGAEEQYWEYTFRPGDTIWEIAKKYTTNVNNWSAIQKVNNIGNGPDRKISPGTRIKIPVAMLKQQPAPAIVIAVNGTASLTRANGDQSELEIGSKLFSGDRVLTNDQQSLRIQFADKSELQVLPGSEIILDKISYHKSTGMVDTRVRLNKGRVNTWVEKLKPSSHYQIITPSAITAVRGTRYRVSSDALISRTEVTEGSVGVSADLITRQVETGFGIVAEKGKPLPEPVKLLPAPEISDNKSATQTHLQVSWHGLDGAAHYRYQLALDENFNQILIDRSTPETNINLKDLQVGQFYLRVRGIDTFKLEGLNASRDFEIRKPPEVENIFEKVILPSGLLLLGP